MPLLSVRCVHFCYYYANRTYIKAFRWLYIGALAGGNEYRELIARPMFDAMKDYEIFVKGPVYYADAARDSLPVDKRKEKLEMELEAEKKIAEWLALLK